MYTCRKKRYNGVKNKTKVVSKLVSFSFFKKSRSPEILMAQGFVRHSQVVRQRSAKPLSPGSNPGGASKKLSNPIGLLNFLSKPTKEAWYVINALAHCM